MKNRQRLFSENGYSIDKVTLVDGNGDVIDTSFEVVDPSGTVISSFNSLEKAKQLFNALLANDSTPKAKQKDWGSLGM
ncbi:hypothetical protein ACK30E_07315 [Aeromonas caviae]